MRELKFSKVFIFLRALNGKSCTKWEHSLHKCSYVLLYKENDLRLGLSKDRNIADNCKKEFGSGINQKVVFYKWNVLFTDLVTYSSRK